MKILAKFCFLAVAVLGCAVVKLIADGPLIAPSVTRITPAGVKKGSTVVLTLEGRNLAGVRTVVFDAPGLAARFLDVKDIPEQAVERRANGAMTPPEGVKQEAKLELTVAAAAEAGIHRFRVQTSVGTSRAVALDVGSLNEIAEMEPNDSLGQSQRVNLPATLVGAIGQPGDKDYYQFSGQAGQEMVFQVVAATLGSQLLPLLTLYDAAGHELGRAGEFSRRPDPVLTFKLPAGGTYRLAISDLRMAGSPDHVYRIHAGALPFVSEVFPLGVRAGHKAEVEVKGFNLGDAHKETVEAPDSGEYWKTFNIRARSVQGESLNKVSLVEGDEPEVFETEPNDDRGHAQSLTLPVTVNGHIAGGRKDTPDQDFFRFGARKGQHFSLEVAAARLGSPLDSVIEVLDAGGRQIPRATLRSVLEHTLTLPAFPNQPGLYIPERSGFKTRDYLMLGSELVQIVDVPDEPDMNLVLKSFRGARLGMLGTSTGAHEVGTSVYKVQILEPGAQSPPNGLPVLTLNYSNDDGGPGYGADARLEFTAPRDGDYLVHIRDVRGLQGENFAYRLTVREARPDFTLTADYVNPSVPLGGSVPLVVSADRRLGYDGPIEVKVKGLPKGITVSPATILPEQDSTVITMTAAADASLVNTPAAPFEILGRGRVKGRDLIRTANPEEPLRVAAITSPADLLITTEPKEIVLEAGKKVPVTLHVDRENGFKGQAYCSILNLPPGVRVEDIGTTGVVFLENETNRKSILVAEDWVGNIEQPMYAACSVQTSAPGQTALAPLNASSPLSLKLRSGQALSAAAAPLRVKR